MPNSRNIQRSFTLVELMVVIVIIMIILGISSGVFTRIVLGSAVDRAGRMVSSQLFLARAEAISKRRQVALIMPGATSFDYGDEIRPYRYSTMRAAYVEADSTEYKFEEWVPGTSWVFLPEGALIAQVDGSYTDELTQSGDDYLPTGNCNVDDTGESVPIATVHNGSSKISFVDKDESTVELDNGKEMRAIVFEKNGACSSKTYVTIVEGIVPAGAKEPVNLQKNNLNVIRVDAFTGKVRFIFH